MSYLKSDHQCYLKINHQSSYKKSLVFFSALSPLHEIHFLSNLTMGIMGNKQSTIKYPIFIMPCRYVLVQLLRLM